MEANEEVKEVPKMQRVRRQVPPPERPAIVAQEESESNEEPENLEEGASMVVTIMKPVALTMLLVIYIVRGISLPELLGAAYQGPTYMTMVYQHDDSDSGWLKFWGAVGNAVVFLCFILLATVLLVVLYKYRCMKVIFGWLFVSVGMLLAMFGGLVFYTWLSVHSLVLDWVTFSFLLWNFSVVGIVAVFWHAPTKLNQAYLVVISALMAMVFAYLPEWTLWSVLAIIAIYGTHALTRIYTRNMCVLC
jgi:presenilin 1